jgi:hypothetical protein
VFAESVKDFQVIVMLANLLFRLTLGKIVKARLKRLSDSKAALDKCLATSKLATSRRLLYNTLRK